MITVKQDDKSGSILVNICNIKSSSVNAIRKAFYYIGKDLKQVSNDMILSKNKSGKIYSVRLGKTRKLHQSSASGEAPANLTGNLRKSIGFEVRGGSQLEFGSRSGPPSAGLSPKQNVADYAAALEVGSSRVAARPYLSPSIEKNRRNTTEHFERELERELNK